MGGNLRPSKSSSQTNLPVFARKGKINGSRGSSGDTCSTKASSKHVNAEKGRKTRHSMPALSSTPSGSHLSSSGVNLEHLAQETPRLLSTGTDHSTDNSPVSLDPPITQAVLSEIDIPRLENDLVLRHHLNFDNRIEFRVNTRGPQAKERQERARKYWHTMATEIALWLAYCQSIAACPSSRLSCVSLPEPGARRFYQGTASRLPRLFGAVRDILKHSLPSEEWPAIDARLDVRFLMQQLERGIYDFTSLSEWLGNFLRRFCSPRRVYLLHTMTSAIRLGVENAKTDSIIHGLTIIFEILQGMSLDTTNHSIRNLHLAWVEETIAFEQNEFLRRIADGWDIIGAQMWFKDLQEADEEAGSGLWILVKALKTAVVSRHKHFPPTLTLDYNRLRTLQSDFQALVYQAACRKTLNKILQSLGWRGNSYKRSYSDLFLKVAALISEQGLRYDYWQRRKSVALEVVKAAYAVCNNRRVPTSKDLEFAEDYLRYYCDPNKPVFRDLRDSLAIDLEDKLDNEVSAISDLTPTQLMRCLLPQKPGFAIQCEIEGLVRIAKRISHIAVLHWRIWGPILYEQPLHIRGRALSHTTLIEEDLHGQRSPPPHTANESGELPRITDLG